MIICYHGTNEENAKSILQQGFRPYTFFARHMEDAIAFGGEHVFEIAMHEVPDGWQFMFNTWIDSNQIVSYNIYRKTQITENKELRNKVFESNI